MAEKGYTVKLSANTTAYQAQMRSAQASTTQFAAGTKRDLAGLGAGMQNVGKDMTRYLSLPLAAGGVAAAKMSVDFETAFGRMQGLAGVTSGEVDGLKQSVLDLAGETGRAPQELADALYFLRSSGLDGAQAMDALKVSAEASAAGLGDTATIADAVSSAMNAYATSGLEAAEATDILVATARAGKAEPEQLAGALGRVLPIASELGITFEDVGGAIASLSLSGNDATTSATLLSNIMSKLLKPSQQGAKALAGVGLSAGQIRQSIADDGLLGTLEMLKERLGDAGFVRFMEDAQAVQGALALTGENAEKVSQTFADVRDNAGATGEAFSKMADTDGFKMKQAWSEMQEALIQAGDVIVPVVAGIAGGMADLVSAFSGLPKGAQTVVLGFLGIVAAAGPLTTLGGKIVSNLDSLKSGFKSLSTVMGSSAAAFGAVGIGLAIAIPVYDSYNKKKQEAKARTAEFTAALEAEAGGQAGATDALMAKMLASKEFVAVQEAMNISVSDMAAYIRGESVPALDSLMASTGRHSAQVMSQTGELDVNVASVMAVRRELGEMRTAYGESTAAIALEGEALGELTGAQEKNVAMTAKQFEAARMLSDTEAGSYEALIAKNEAQAQAAERGDRITAGIERQYAATLIAAGVSRDAAGMYAAQATASGELAGAVEGATSKQERFAASSELAAEQLQGLIDIMFAAVGGVFDYESALLGVDNSYATFIQNQKEFNWNLEHGKIKGEEAASALRSLRLEEIGLAGDVLAASETFAVQEGAVAGSAEAASMQIYWLTSMRDKYPELREEIDQYIGGLSKIPQEKKTDVKVETGAAAGAIGQLKGMFGSLPKETKTEASFMTGGAASATGRLKGLFGSVPKDTRTTASYMTGSAASATGRLKGMFGSVPKDTRTTASYMTGSASSATARLKGTFGSVQRRTDTSAYYATGSATGLAGRLKGTFGSVQRRTDTSAYYATGSASGAVGQLKGLFGSVPRTTQTTAEFHWGGAAGAISQLKGMFGSIPRNVSTTVTTNRVTSYSSVGGVPRPMASGGFVDRPTYALVGEGRSREAVLPYDDPARLTSMVHDSRLEGKLVSALEAGAGGRGGGGSSSAARSTSVTVNNNDRPVTATTIAAGIRAAELLGV